MLTKIMVAISDFTMQNILWLILGTFLVIGSFVWFLKTPRGKMAKDSFLFKIPVLSDVSIKGTMARTTRNLALLLGGGISITDALDLIVLTSDNHIYKNAFIQLRSDVNEGLLLSQALKKQPLFPLLLSQIVGVGELTGKLEPNLESVADFYEEETDRAVSKATQLLTPLMTILIGGLVMVIALSMYQPMYSIAGTLQK